MDSLMSNFVETIKPSEGVDYCLFSDSAHIGLSLNLEISNEVEDQLL